MAGKGRDAMRALWLAGILLCAVPGLAAQEREATAADEAAVRGMVARYAAARDARDPAAIRGLFVPDADQLVSSGEWRRGREALVQGMQASSAQNPGSRTLIVETIRFVAADVALADARYEIEAAEGSPPRRMWSTFLMTRSDDGWLIAAIRNMLPAN